MPPKKRKPPKQRPGQKSRPKHPKAPAPANAAPLRSKPTAAERYEQGRRERRRRRLLVRLALVGLVAVVLAGYFANRAVRDRRDAAAVREMTAGDCTYDRQAAPGRDHVRNPTFVGIYPPAGGDHTANVAEPGRFQEQLESSMGPIVHAMEHGRIVIWHQPELPAPQLDELREFADRFPRDVLLVSRPQLPKPVSATAWHRRLICQGVEEAALRKFVQTFRNRGPEKVAARAS